MDAEYKKRTTPDDRWSLEGSCRAGARQAMSLPSASRMSKPSFQPLGMRYSAGTSAKAWQRQRSTLQSFVGAWFLRRCPQAAHQSKSGFLAKVRLRNRQGAVYLIR